MKTCTKCKIDKDFNEFPKRASSKDGRTSWCKLCYSKHARDKYQSDPAERARKERNKARIVEANRKALWDYLSTHQCVDCGNSDPRVLEFDHRDELTKSHNVTELWNYSWARMMKEIEKCDVRCANCHRIRTQEQFGTWRYGWAA